MSLDLEIKYIRDTLQSLANRDRFKIESRGDVRHGDRNGNPIEWICKLAYQKVAAILSSVSVHLRLKQQDRSQMI